MLTLEKIKQYQTCAKQLNKFKADEMKLRREIALEVNNKASKSALVKKDGDKLTYTDEKNGFTVKVKNKFNYKHDSEGLELVFESLTPEEKACFERKLNFYPPRYLALLADAEEALDIEEYITSAPGAPEVTVSIETK